MKLLLVATYTSYMPSKYNLVCPKSFFCKHMILVVDKYYENGHENIFGLSVVLELKVENWTLLFLKKMRRIRLILDVEKLLWNIEFFCFRPSTLIWSKGQKYFYGRFFSFLALLSTTEFRCLQKNNIGHTKVYALCLS